MPCRFALQTARVPARRWATRADLVAAVEVGREFLDTAALGDIDLRRIAAAAGLSPFHYHRLFVALYGATPGRVLIRRRLREAAVLLAETRLPLAAVARRVGLAGAPGLCRLMRKELGFTPDAVRRKTRKK